MSFRATHGTEGGYYRHRRTKTAGDDWHVTPCQPCADAHAQLERDRTSRRETRKVVAIQHKEPCIGCHKRDHLAAGYCNACRRAAPGEYNAGWVLKAGIWAPAHPLRGATA